jgi:nickel transport protein
MNNFFRFGILLFVLPFFVVQPQSVSAHKLTIFAWSEGHIIHGETSFSGNKKPHDIEIKVQDAVTHKILLTTRTDEQGNFRFILPEKAIRQQLDLLLIADSGDGHRGEWRLSATEYLSLPLQQVQDKEKKITPATTSASASAAAIRSSSPCFDEQLLRRIIDEEMDSKLAPIKKILAENRNQAPSLRDILGGIGYILGLAGIFAWFKTRKQA